MQEFCQRAEQLGISLSDDQLSLMERYVCDLQSYNEHTNLVSSSDRNLLWENHILDSLTVSALVRDSITGGGSLIDIGSGAGFPGMVIAIAVPSVRVTLVDSVGKKTRFLEEAVKNLGLQDRVRVMTARAEELSHKPGLRAKFDLATARAVGSFDLVCELTMPFLKIGGKLLAQKSKNQLEAEQIESSPAIALLGGGAPRIETPDAAALGRDLAIVVVEKNRQTPSAYPRNASQLKKPIR